jgi:hypothetical protein
MSNIGPLLAGQASVLSEEDKTTPSGALGFKPLAGNPSYKALTCNQYQNQANNMMGNTDIYDIFVNVRGYPL